MSKDPKANYYDAGGIEVQTYIKAKLTREEYIGFCLGNVLKYSSRMMHKDPQNPLRDAEKADYYLNWLRQALEEAKKKPCQQECKGDGLTAWKTTKSTGGFIVQINPFCQKCEGTGMDATDPNPTTCNLCNGKGTYLATVDNETKTIACACKRKAN